MLPRQQKAAIALIEEIEKRGRRRLELKRCSGDEWWDYRQPLIALGTNEICPGYPAEVAAALNKKTLKAEGFQIISVQAPRPLTVVHGADDRGLLYGIGKLLRLAKITPGKFLLPENLNITDSPRFPLRGHQLGYRPKTNAYDTWTEQTFDQYIRELAFFGANSIEILPPSNR
jgi:alpha-glucuronidase